MGGAFVAVANDASAYHWNPAGSMKGGSISSTVEWGSLHFGNPSQAPVPGMSVESSAISSLIGSPMGVSYGHLEFAQVVGVRADGSAVVESLRVHHIGATASQTLFPGVVVGATAKFLRGQAVSGDSWAETAGGALDDALGLSGLSSSHFDLDVGVMAKFGPVRAGATLKNVLQPSFTGANGLSMRLPRLIRAGVALVPNDGLTLAFDMELDTADPLVGLRRMMALGGEFSLGSHVALRGGLRWSRDGGWQPVWAGGASLRVFKGSWVDGYATYSASYDRGFGVALRVGG